jgi:hypothetical protein
MLLLLVAVLSGCDSRRPTAPEGLAEERPVTSEGLIGEWSGELGPHPDGEDWSRVTIAISRDGGVLAGRLIPRQGSTLPVVVEMNEERGLAILSVSVHELSAGRRYPCTGYGIVVPALQYEGGRPVGFRGTLTGRCPSTLAGAVRFQRIQ